MSPADRRLWPQLRALLVAAHVVAVLASAFPSPSGGMNRASWSDPTVQAELAAWAGRLSVDPEVFEERLWDFAVVYMKGRSSLLKPFQPYYRHAGTYQAWHMFVAPHRNPARLHIDLSRPGEDGAMAWETLYISRDPEARWRAALLDHGRTRAALFRYTWRHYRGPYRQLGQWLAQEAAAEFPDAKRLRLRWYRYRTPTPEQVHTDTAPEGRFEKAMVFSLESYR